MRSMTRTSAVGRRARCLLRAPAPTMRGDLSACRTVRIRCCERRAPEAANRQAGEMPGSIVARSPVVAATAMASHVHGDSDHRQSACATVHRRPAGRAATAAAAFDIASGTSSAFRTMCLVRWCALRVVGTAPQSALPSRWRRATVRAAELAVAAGLVVVAGGGEPCRCVTASAGARSVRCALRARRVTRAGAEGRGSCGVAAWRAGRPPAWPRRCDRARCCRTAPPSASRHRARAGRKHRTARSR